MANSSFTLEVMVASIADKLMAMKWERAVNNGTGRDLVVLKASVVDGELEKLGLQLHGAPRNANGVVDGLRSRRDRGRVAAAQSGIRVT